MRPADQLTAPIRATDTDRIQRWPASNTLIDLAPGYQVPGTPRTAEQSAAAPAVVESRPPARAARVPRAAPLLARAPRTDAPIPAVGDLWGLSTPDPILSGTVVAPLPYPSIPVRRRTAPASSAALTLALLSMPLVLLAGVGLFTGFASIVCAAFGIRQVRRDPQRYRGNGKNVAAIVIGTGCMMFSAPLLLLALFLFGV